MKKRILSLLLAVSIACSMLVVPANAAASNVAVQTAVTLGGLTSEQASALSTALTRGQLAKLLVAFSAYRESAATQGNTGTLFTDVDSGNEYAPYIRIAVQQGWLSGYTDGSFRPDNGVTLEEACTAALKLLGYDVTTLSGSFPAAQLNKASSLGLRAGLSAVQGQGLTLEDAAVLFYNALTASTAENQTYAATLGFTVTDGRIDLSSVLLSSVEGPFVADGTTQLPFAPAAVYRNDTVATDAALNAYDVYYYSASARTVWIYSRKAAGRITAVSPSASAPTDSMASAPSPRSARPDTSAGRSRRCWNPRSTGASCPQPSSTRASSATSAITQPGFVALSASISGVVSPDITSTDCAPAFTATAMSVYSLSPTQQISAFGTPVKPNIMSTMLRFGLPM